MIKKLLFRIVLPFLELYYFMKYKNIWKIKEILSACDKPDFILLNVYNNYFARMNSWIGHNSKFHGIPCFPHGVSGIFISGDAIIGKNVVIFQHVTIGSNILKDSKNTGSPIIGDNVYIGSGAKIIGNVNIRNNCRIGANAVVYTDMPMHSVAVQSPTRIINKENLDNRFFTKDSQGKWLYYDDGKFCNTGG